MIDANTFLATFEAGPEGCAEPFAQCFDTPGTFAGGEAVPFEAGSPPEGLAGPGLVVFLDFGETACAVAIPASFPLPDWYRTPDDSQSARLQTLAMEWSLTLAPEGFEAVEFATRLVEDVTAVGAGEGAEAVPLTFTPDGGGDPGTIFWVGPVAIPEEEPEPPPAEPEPAAPEPAAAADPVATDDPKKAEWEAERNRRIRRLQQVPVEVVVELASKKVDLESVVAIGPGSLVTFSKSCEEPVDLYVNNFRYCRGEAVKIGENFGLKVTEVGVVEKRKQKVF